MRKSDKNGTKSQRVVVVLTPEEYHAFECMALEERRTMANLITHLALTNPDAPVVERPEVEEVVGAG